MLNYCELPPTETDEISFEDSVELGVGVAEKPELPKICSECDKELDYTYRVVIPSICSHCLQTHSMPAGAQAARNTHDMATFVKSSPPGYHWDLTTQSHMPDRPQATVTVTPGNTYRVTVGAGGSGGVNVSGGAGAGGGGGSSYGGGGRSYAYAPGRDDPRDWSPSQISAYLQRNYSPSELRERYSELRQELLYGKPGSYTLHEDPDSEPETEVRSIHLPQSHLTGREDSAILNENGLNSNPEETEMPMEHILSREEADAAYKHAAAALARLDELEKKYSPDLPNGSVIAFQLTFPGRTQIYSYAAVKAAGLWFPTGKVHPSHQAGVGLEWTTLLAGLEQFQATDFEVLRTGVEVHELEAGRTVVLPPGSVTTAFDGDPGDEDDDV